jgi:hypothetical protein
VALESLKLGRQVSQLGRDDVGHFRLGLQQLFAVLLDTIQTFLVGGDLRLEGLAKMLKETFYIRR